MLVIGKQKTIDIPHEEGQQITIKALSWKKLKDAQRAQQTQGIEFMREVGAELLQALRSADVEKVKQIENAQEANINNYDRAVLLAKGLVGWSYEAELTPENIEQLDEVTAAFAADTIFAFSRGDSHREAGEG